ncbi:hypothetical protein ACIGXM_35205 [Kitasatospora sp. NPDC052896]|uniref:hypothetical protein n=1 Tax=Kitasatospora sp. NPDC052896 TaxID=3364061 RepID=UPI0037C987A4
MRTSTEQPPYSPPAFWFTLPAGFLEIPLTGAPENRLPTFADALAPLFPDATPQQKLSLLRSSEAAARRLLAAGTGYLAGCLFRTDGGGLTTALLAVQLVGARCRDRRRFARSTARQWAGEEAAELEAGVLEVPYGPVALLASRREVLVPAAVFGVGHPQVEQVYQLRAGLPLLTHDRAAILTLTTRDADSWSDYLGVFSHVLASVSATEPRDGEPSFVTTATGAVTVRDDVRSVFG